jgi:hypothetical protein
MPFEMITMLGSTVLGGVMSIWSVYGRKALRLNKKNKRC